MPPSPSLTSLSSFTTALKSFTSSPSAFTILRTIPPQSSSSSESPPSSSPTKRLIILDSSFNPPTTAHLEMVTSALRQKQAPAATNVALDESARVLLLLSVENADKKPKPASFPHRLLMMEALATHIHSSSSNSIAVDVGVTKKPYFHDKSAAIARSGAYPPDAQQTFLAGYDTLIRILNPKYYPDGMRTSLDPFFERARLRVVMRTDGEWGGVDEQEGWVRGLKDGEEDWGGQRGWVRDRVELVEAFGDGVSSSRVREMVKGGKGGWEDMVPKGLDSIIREEGLYRGYEQ